MATPPLDPFGRARLIFITGTDTGVGKTLLTALLLNHLRQRGLPALALKPFSSGDRADAQLFESLQDADLTLDEINSFHFREPLAPALAARKHHHLIRLQDVLTRIQAVAACQLPRANTQPTEFMARNPKLNTPFLLIEGIGGLLVPLGEGYSVLDLIQRLTHPSSRRAVPRCEVIIVSRNQLGTLNHTLLTVRALENALSANARHPPYRARRPASSGVKVVLMDIVRPDVASASNPAFLTELIAPARLFRLPYLGPDCLAAEGIKKNSRALGSTLESLLK